MKTKIAGDTPVKAEVVNRTIVITLADGRNISFPASKNELLAKASDDVLADIELRPFGVHWPDLDEDLSIAGMLKGRFGAMRGGKRLGAGRPAKGHVRMQLNVDPSTRETIESEAQREAKSISAVVDNWAIRFGQSRKRAKQPSRVHTTKRAA